MATGSFFAGCAGLKTLSLDAKQGSVCNRSGHREMIKLALVLHQFPS